MPECDAQCMEVETSFLLDRGVFYSIRAVEKIADDRTAESEGVGAVHAKLMRAAGDRMEQQVCCSVWVYMDYVIVCMSLFALLEVYFLSWTFIIVRC